MPLTIAGTEIRTVEIVDDRPEVRESMAFPVEELDLQALKYDGPIGDLDKFIDEVRHSAEAVICDHHLRIGDYSRVNGSEIVARLYRDEFPALLCTRWQQADLQEMRPLRRFIPVLLEPGELTPDTIK